MEPMQFSPAEAFQKVLPAGSLIRLWNEKKCAPGLTEEASFQPYMKLFLLPGDAPKGMVIVLPGGGYRSRAAHEADPVAETFNREGYHACVVHYRVSPCRYPDPQEDALRAVRIIRTNAEAWRVKPDKIAILGFSSGGHLCASTGIVFDRVPAKDGDAFDGVPARPDAMILCYPVITAFPEEVSHRNSFRILTGKENPSDEEMKPLSWDLNVRPDTPPAFLWHTAEDKGVPPANSMKMANALMAAGVPCELHLFPRGGHGTGLGPVNYPEIQQWPRLCGLWLRNMGWGE